METEIIQVSTAYQILFMICIIILSLLVLACFFRAVRGPGIVDRIMAVNMIGTMIIVIIAVLSVILEESYLLDVCLIYAMISFLAVIVLTKVYMGVYREKKLKEKKEGKSAV